MKNTKITARDSSLRAISMAPDDGSYWKWMSYNNIMIGFGIAGLIKNEIIYEK